MTTPSHRLFCAALAFIASTCGLLAEYDRVIHINTSENADLKRIFEAALDRTTIYLHGGSSPYDRRRDIVLKEKSHLEIIGVPADGDTRTSLRGMGAKYILRLEDCDHVTIRNVAFVEGKRPARNLWCFNVQDITLDNVAQLGRFGISGILFSPRVDKSSRPWKYEGSVENILIDNWYIEDMGTPAAADNPAEDLALKFIYNRANQRKWRLWNKRKHPKDRFDFAKTVSKLNAAGLETSAGQPWSAAAVRKLIGRMKTQLWGIHFYGFYAGQVRNVTIRNGAYRSPNRVIGMNVINVDLVHDPDASSYFDPDSDLYSGTTDREKRYAGDNIRIYNNEFRDFGHSGIAVARYRDVEIYGNTFYDQVGHPFRNSCQAIHIEVSRDWRIHHNRAVNCLKGIDCLVAWYGTVDHNEVLESTLMPAFRIMGCHDLDLRENTARGGPFGFDVQKHFRKDRPRSHSVRLHRNRIVDTRVAIRAKGMDNLHITNNLIRTPGQEALLLLNVAESQITGNTLLTKTERSLDALVVRRDGSRLIRVKNNRVNRVD